MDIDIDVLYNKNNEGQCNTFNMNLYFELYYYKNYRIS